MRQHPPDILPDLWAGYLYLEQKALVALEEDRLDDAITTAEQILAIAATADRFPLYDTYHWRVHLTFAAFELARRTIAAGELTDEQLDRQASLFPSLDVRPHLLAIFVGERAGLLAGLQGQSTYPPTSGGEWAITSLSKLAAPNDPRPVLAHADDFVEAMAADDWPSLLKGLDRASDHQEVWERACGLAGLTHYTRAYRVGETGNYFGREAAMVEARRRLTLLAIEAERYRQRTGRFPASLEEFAADLPAELRTDPFNDSPLHARTLDSAGTAAAEIVAELRGEGPPSAGEAEAVAALTTEGLVLYATALRPDPATGRLTQPHRSPGRLLLILPDRTASPAAAEGAAKPSPGR